MALTIGLSQVSDIFLSIIYHLTYAWWYIVIPDVWLGGGAEYFMGEKALNGKNYYDDLKKLGYKTVWNKKELQKYHGNDKLLGAFRTSNLDT